MLKKHSFPEDISSQTQVKSSVQRGIRTKIIEQYPLIEATLEDLIPKKSPLVTGKCRDNLNLVIANNEVLFFNFRTDPYFPVLQILHKYPTIMTQVQVDRGAIKHIFQGANIMAPGLTSKGGKLPDGIEKGTLVAVMAEGKQHALAVGQMMMSSAEIREKNQGIAIETVHYLGDPLYHIKLE